MKYPRRMVLLCLTLFFTASAAYALTEAQVLYKKGQDHFIKREFYEAIEAYSAALELFHGNRSLAAVHHGRGHAYMELRKWDKALEDFSLAAELQPDFNQINTDIGSMYFQKGELQRAIEYYSKGLVRNSGDVTALNGRGLCFYSLGNFDKALEDLDRAIDLQKSEQAGITDSDDPAHRMISVKRWLSVYYCNRGIVYFASGEPGKAAEDYSEAISIYAENYPAYYFRGAMYLSQWKLNEAIADFTQAIRIMPDNYDVLFARGNTYFAIGDMENAIKDYDKVAGLEPDMAQLYRNKGLYYGMNGDMEKARENFEKYIDMLEKSPNVINTLASVWGYILSRIQFGASEGFNELRNEYPVMDMMYDLSRREADIGIKKAEQLRENGGIFGTDLMMQSLYLYYAGVDFSAEDGYHETAFEHSEKLRARGFLDQFGTRAALDLLDEKERGEIQPLMDTINEAHIILNMNSGGKGSPDLYLSASETLRAAAASLAEKEAAVKNERYAALRRLKPVTAERAIGWLEEDTAVLEYVLWDSEISYVPIQGQFLNINGNTRPLLNSYCIVLTKNGARAVKLPAAWTRENPDGFNYSQITDNLRNKIIPETDDEGNYLAPRDESEFETERNELYRALLKPVIDQNLLEGIKNIIIVPDSNLSKLPFDMLRDSGGVLFGAQYNISFSPSVTISIMASERGNGLFSPSSDTILALGGAWYDRTINPYTGTENSPAPRDTARSFTPAEMYYDSILAPPPAPAWENLDGTAGELDYLKTLSSNFTEYRGGSVTERLIHEMSDNGRLDQYDLIHFAGHGYFAEDDPAMSSLVFSEVSGWLPDTGCDGYLTMREAALLNFKAKMMILSACETGLGEVGNRGDGIAGLMRSFMVAGVDKIGVSLWPINDAAAEVFMRNIYKKALKDGKSFRDAYQEVKREFRNGGWHPYYWAAFTMYE